MQDFCFLYIFRGFYVYGVPLPPLRGQHTVLCHPKWLPTSGLTEFAVCWGGAGFEPRTTDLQSGALISSPGFECKMGQLTCSIRLEETELYNCAFKATTPSNIFLA